MGDDQLPFTSHMYKLKLKLYSSLYALFENRKMTQRRVRKLFQLGLFESPLRLGAAGIDSALQKS